MADTKWTDFVYLGIALAGFFVVKKLAAPTQSGYQQIGCCLNEWTPLSKEERLRLGLS